MSTSSARWRRLMLIGSAVLILLITTENIRVSDLELSSPSVPGPEQSFHSNEEERLAVQEEIENQPLDVAEEAEDNIKDTRIRVCTVALNPRQGSLFRTNLLGLYGSGKYRYALKKECPWEWPRVRLISFVKCCDSLGRVYKAVTDALQEFDVVIITGDEYCHVQDPRPQFRQYHGTQIISTGRNFTSISTWKPNPKMMDYNNTIRFPLYIPLGPREEFLQIRITPKDIVPSSKRAYLFNFLGSMTSYSRQVLKRVIFNDLDTDEKMKMYPSFVHITDKWHLKVTQSNGYIEPEEYRRVLLNSAFTLCPNGHNPEAYRIYEALEAGSIPIVALDPWYNRASCNEAFKPYRAARAPFIYLNGGWKQLESFLERYGKNETWVRQKQVACMDWYKNWMKNTALRFEAVMEHRFDRRLAKPRPEPIVDSDEQNDERDELNAIHEEERENEQNR